MTIGRWLQTEHLAVIFTARNGKVDKALGLLHGEVVQE
jgi:hypothetical protein